MTALETEAKEWFLKAAKDYCSFLSLSTHKFTKEPALFHAQQAVEKWLQGLATIQNISVPKTHTLINLLKIIEPFYPELSKVLTAC